MDLRKITREVIAQADDVSVPALTVAVAARIDDEAEALKAALPAFIRSVIVSDRSSGAVKPPTVGKSLPGSWKVNAIRDGWQRHLREVYATPDGNKRVGDMTHDDLLHLASVNEDQAKRKLGKAKGWRKLADCMTEQGVAVVRDLDAQTLMVTFGSAA